MHLSLSRSVLYLDPDTHVSNFQMSIDGYLERARRLGDEGLLYRGGGADSWKLLFASGYWQEPDSINSGAFFVRNDPHAICLLRLWRRESMRREYQRLPQARREHEAMRRLLQLNTSRKWAARVRMLPTARFRRRDDHTWAGAAAWERSATAERNESYSHDDFIHAGVRRHPRDIARLTETLATAWWVLLGNANGFACKCVPDRESCNRSMTCQPEPPQKKSHPWSTHVMEAPKLAKVLHGVAAHECGQQW